MERGEEQTLSRDGSTSIADIVAAAERGGGTRRGGRWKGGDVGFATRLSEFCLRVYDFSLNLRSKVSVTLSKKYNWGAALASALLS